MNKREIGKIIQRENSTTKEKEICDYKNLTQIGGTKTKIDGTNGESNYSIKNFKGSSTQVHLTTQKKFIETFKLDGNLKLFINLFCGDKSINNKGLDRFYITEIDEKIVSEFITFLNNNTKKIIDYIVCNNENITDVTYRNTKTNDIYSVEHSMILESLENLIWVPKKGGIHLKNKENKTFFHLQREGKKNKNNRYNVLFHIHKNLFLNIIK